jgi:hypothetical protein
MGVHLVHVLISQCGDMAQFAGGLVRPGGITGVYRGGMHRIMLGRRHGVAGVAPQVLRRNGILHLLSGRTAVTGVASHSYTIDTPVFVQVFSLNVAVMAGAAVSIRRGRKDVNGVMHCAGI